MNIPEFEQTKIYHGFRTSNHICRNEEILLIDSILIFIPEEKKVWKLHFEEILNVKKKKKTLYLVN